MPEQTKDQQTNMAAFNALRAFDALMSGFPPCFVQKFITTMNQMTLAVTCGHIAGDSDAVAKEIIAAINPIMRRELAKCESFKNN